MTTETLNEITEDAPQALTKIKALSLPDTAAATRGAIGALRMAETFVITSNDDYEMAAGELGSIKKKLKALEDQRTAITGPINLGLKLINALFKGPMGTLESAESTWKRSMLAYTQEQERKAAEERRIAEAAAAAERKRVEDEARRVEQVAAAERKRVEDEEAARQAAARAEQDRLSKEAAAAAAAGNAAAAAEAERKAEEQRSADVLAAQQAAERREQAEAAAAAEAEALRMQAQVISAPVVHMEAARAKGISVAKSIDFEVVDLLALVKHIAENPALINLVVADSVKLRAYTKSLGMNSNLPGVRVFEKRTMGSRAA